MKPPRGSSNSTEATAKSSVAANPSSTPSPPGLIAIPYVSGDAPPHLVKFRAVPPEPLDAKGRPQRYSRLAGGKTTLFLPMGDPGSRGVFLVGGEFDALSIVEALLAGGFNLDDPETVPFVVAGVVSGERAWNEAATEAIEEVEDVVLCLDSDAAGAAATSVLADAIGRHRCRKAKWPNGANDANDALTAGSLDAFEVLALWRNATAIGVSGIRTTTELEDDVVAHVHSRPAEGWPTGIRCLDELIGGLRPGEVTVVTGQTGAGKSTFASQVVARLSLEAGDESIPSLVCPFELGSRRQIVKLLRQKTRREPFEMAEEELRHSLRSLDPGGNLFLFDWYGSVEIDRFRETLLYSIRRLGVRLVLVDHLHFAVNRSGGGADYFARLEEFSEMVAEVFVDSPAHGIVVAQPGKTGDGRHRDDHIVQLGDVRGGASVTQAADNGLSLYRRRSAARDDEDESDGIWFESGIVSLKQRDRSGREGNVPLTFNRRVERFFDPANLPGGNPATTGELPI